MSTPAVSAHHPQLDGIDGDAPESSPTPDVNPSRRFSLKHTNGLTSSPDAVPNGVAATPSEEPSSIVDEAVENNSKNAEPKNRKDSIAPLLSSWSTKLGGSSSGESEILLKNLTSIFDEIAQRFEKLENTKSPDSTSPAEPAPEEEATLDPSSPHTKAKNTQAIEATTKFFCQSVPAELEEWKDPPKHIIGVLYKRSDNWVEESPDSNYLASFEPPPHQIVILEVRIESKPIVTFLNKLTKTTLTHDGHMLFRQPFRMLLRQRNDVNDHIAELEEEANAVPKIDEISEDSTGSAGVDPGVKAKDDDTPAENSDQALAHFRQLDQFTSSYLAEQIAMIETLKGSTQTHISFEHLWMLFDSGTDVYCRSRKGGHRLRSSSDAFSTMVTERLWNPQAFRVVSTVGGGSSRTMPHIGWTKSSAKVTVSKSARDCFSDLSIQCYYIEYTGTQWQPVLDHIVLKPYDGTMEITELEVFPIQYRSQIKGTEDPYLDLYERGSKYVNLTRMSHLRYEGFTAGDTSEQISSPVIIDMATSCNEQDPQRYLFKDRVTRADIAEEMGRSDCLEVTGHACSLGCCPGGKCEYMTQQVTVLNNTLDQISKQLEELDNNTKSTRADPARYLEVLTRNNLRHLLPGVAVGYSLRNRKWVNLKLDLLREIHYNALDGGWDDLVLPGDHKRLVRAMVEKFADKDKGVHQEQGQSFEADLVSGKGKGCIILLHGVPGVGKTSTAECVAAYTKRPLLPITCGDIGYTPADVERFLDNIFTLAHKWGCVLLLDEADVFLAKRLKHDVKHNGLVSVFLRVLEYYSGILFLTTNRVGTIDDAFRSRIHLTLFYPQLDRSQTIQVWESNIRRVEEYNKYRAKHGLPIMKYKTEELLEFAGRRFDAKLRWNGRQIRNAFQTAIALAEYQAIERAETKGDKTKTLRLGRKQFKTIAKATKAFDEYLYTLYGGDEDKLADRDKSRLNPKKMPRKSHVTVESEELSASESSSSSAESEEETETETEPETKSRGKSRKRAEAKKESTTKRHSTTDSKKDKSKAKGKKRGHESGKKAKSKQRVSEEDHSETSDQQLSSDEDER